jgi:hypothetical protein
VRIFSIKLYGGGFERTATDFQFSRMIEFFLSRFWMDVNYCWNFSPISLENSIKN